jgi:DNA-binding MarR family transcriptional regulator
MTLQQATPSAAVEPAPVERVPVEPVPMADRTGLLAHKVGCLLLKAFEDGLGELELSSRGYFVLSHINVATPPSQQDLARRLLLDPTSMVAIVDELERLDLVVRKRNAQDRRRYDLHLTELGRQALATADEALDRTETAFLAPLTLPQRRQFHGLLEKLLAPHS